MKRYVIYFAMADPLSFYRIYLKTELDRRLKSNPRYSLRAFAKSMKIDHGYLSKVLSGKILMTVETAEAIAKNLKLNEELRRKFLLSVAEEQKCSALYGVDPSLTDCDEE